MSERETLWICPNCKSKNLRSKEFCYLCGARSPDGAGASAPPVMGNSFQEKRILLNAELEARFERMKKEEPPVSHREHRRWPKSRTEWAKAGLLTAGMALALLGLATLMTELGFGKQPSHRANHFLAIVQSVCTLGIGMGCMYFAMILKDPRKSQGIQSLEELAAYCEKNGMSKQAAEVREQLEEMKNNKKM